MAAATKPENAGDEFAEDRQGAAIAAVLAAANEDDALENWSIEVRRTGTGPDTLGQKQPIIFRCGIDELEALPFVLQKHYMYGERFANFRAWVRNKKTLFRVIDFPIEADPRNAPDKFSQQAPPASGAMTAQPIAAPAASSDLQIVLAEMNRTNQAILALLSSRPAERSMGDSMKEMGAIIGIVKELMPQPSNTMADTFKTALELGREIAQGNGGGGGGWSEVITAALSSPVVGDIAKNVLQARTPGPQNGMRQRPMQQNGPQRQQQPPAVPAPTPTPPNNPVVQGDKILLELRDTVSFLVGKAGEGADPNLWGDYAWQRLPQFAKDAMDSADDPVTFVAQFNPAVSNHRAWFEGLLDKLYDIAEKELGPDNGGVADPANVASAPAGGSTGDA